MQNQAMLLVTGMSLYVCLEQKRTSITTVTCQVHMLLVRYSHVAGQLVSYVATGKCHMCDVTHAQATVFMAHLGAGMATGFLQPLTILGTLDMFVCLIIRVTLPAATCNMAL